MKVLFNFTLKYDAEAVVNFWKLFVQYKNILYKEVDTYYIP